jgi:hypothetical protein
VKERSLLPGVFERIVSAGGQVQAAGLVGTIWPLRTNGTNVSLLDQPKLDARDRAATKLGPDELFHEMFQRLLVGNVQKQ